MTAKYRLPELHAPLNLPVLKYLKTDLGRSQDEIDTWYRHWLQKTLVPLEARLSAMGSGDYLFDAPGLFECVLIPQLYNARRFDFDLSAMPHMTRIEAACLKHPAFVTAHPDSQPDSPAKGGPPREEGGYRIARLDREWSNSGGGTR